MTLHRLLSTSNSPLTIPIRMPEMTSLAITNNYVPEYPSSQRVDEIGPRGDVKLKAALDLLSSTNSGPPTFGKPEKHCQPCDSPPISGRLSNFTGTSTTGSTGSIEASLRSRAFMEARRVFSERFESTSDTITTPSSDCSSCCWQSLSQSCHSISEIPKFSKKELILGKRLGKGSFSNVDEIRGIALLHENRRSPLARLELLGAGASSTVKTPSSLPAALKKIARPALSLRREDTVAINNQESRAFIAQHCFRSSGDSRYAIKMVRRDVFQSDDHSNVIAGLCDLAVETVFLSSLEHPNIVKLRGTADMDHPFSCEYFLVLDRLVETLQRRIEHSWKAKEKRLYSFWGRLSDRRGRKRLDFFEHRLERAFDLGSAIDYLHQKKIIHRDIKPDNIGFDVRDDIKLFDFGMAKKLKPEYKVDDENYKLSFCGSPRYMAPEVWAKKPYNSSCDVYSFGVVLYEMIALRRAFEFCSCSDSVKFAAEVFEAGQRPNVNHMRAPPSIKELLPFCWDENPQYRHDMANVNLSLRKELILLRRGDESRLPNFVRRRSTFIFQQNDGQSGGKSREGSSKSFAESVQSILSDPNSASSRPRDRKRASVAELKPLNLSKHSISLSLNSTLGEVA